MFDNGAGEGVANYSAANSSSLCNGQWHSVTVRKDQSTATLQVDGAPSSSGTASNSFVSVDIGGALYAGGIPGRPCHQLNDAHYYISSSTLVL